MSIKPDGWVPVNWKWRIEKGAICYLRSEESPAYSVPICLISPEKAEWIEKVKERLELQSSSWCHDLLQQLDSIEQREGEK